MTRIATDLFTESAPRLTQDVRFKTTSEHVLGLRGGPRGRKTQSQIAWENKNHMNFMPVPEGCWQEYYNARNQKWTINLAASVTALAITTYVVSMKFYIL